MPQARGANLLMRPLGVGLPFTPVRSHFWITGTNPGRFPANHPFTVIPDARAFTRSDVGALIIGLRESECQAFNPDTLTDKLEDFDMVLFPYENERGITIKDVLRGDRAEECGNCEAAKNSDAAEDIAVIIGPEGGFSDQEAKEIVAAGGISLSLGKTVLRTETAGMTAIAMIMYEKEL